MPSLRPGSVRAAAGPVPGRGKTGRVRLLHRRPGSPPLPAERQRRRRGATRDADRNGRRHWQGELANEFRREEGGWDALEKKVLVHPEQLISNGLNESCGCQLNRLQLVSLVSPTLAAAGRSLWERGSVQGGKKLREHSFLACLERKNQR